jgi:hypothetical protein
LCSQMLARIGDEFIEGMVDDPHDLIGDLDEDD